MPKTTSNGIPGSRGCEGAGAGCVVRFVTIPLGTAVGEETNVPACEKGGTVPDTGKRVDVLSSTGAEMLSLGLTVTAKYENPVVEAVK